MSVPDHSSQQPALAVGRPAAADDFLPLDAADLVAVVPAQLLSRSHELGREEGDRWEPGENNYITLQLSIEFPTLDRGY